MEHVDLNVKEENKNYQITYSVAEDQKKAWLHFTFEDENRAKKVVDFLRNKMQSLPIVVHGNRITIPPSSEKNLIGAVYVQEMDDAYIDINFGSNESHYNFLIYMNTDDKSSFLKIKNSKSLEGIIRFNTEDIQKDDQFQIPRSKEDYMEGYWGPIPSIVISKGSSNKKQNLTEPEKKILNEVDKKIEDFGVMTNNSDDILQDKYDVLWGIHDYLENRISLRQLSLIVDRCPQYDVQRYFNLSDTARLLTEAVSAKSRDQSFLPPAVTDFIPAAEKIRHTSPHRLNANTKIEVGTSGYIYLDRSLHGKSSVLYYDETKNKDENKNKAQTIADHAMKMIEKKKQLYKDGGYINGRWAKDSDNMYRDKDKVLSEAIWFSLDESDIKKLAMKADLYHQYDYARFGKSETKEMIETVLTARNKSLKDLEVDDQFYNTNKSDYNPIAELIDEVSKGNLNTFTLGFQKVRIEAGKSGYIYLDGRLASFINEQYKTKEERINCVNICNDIKAQMWELAKKGGYTDGKWTKDSDHRYRHKFEVLSMTLGYLMEGVTHDQLSLVGDKCKNYDENWAGRFGRSDTGKLLDRALNLKRDLALNEVNSRVINNALRDSKVDTHNKFFKREKNLESRAKRREKQDMENLELEVGKSEYIYIESLPNIELKKIYKTKEEAEECVALCKDIQKELKKLRASAGNDWKNDIQVDKKDIEKGPENKNKEDIEKIPEKIKQPGGIYYHKYRVLLKAMEFVLDEVKPRRDKITQKIITPEESLEKTLKNYPKYNEKRIKISTSTTEDLLDRAIKLRGIAVNKHLGKKI